MLPADASPQPWFLIAAVVLPLTSLLVVAWFIWRAQRTARTEGRTEARAARTARTARTDGWRPWKRGRREGVEARWTTGTCRRCLRPAPVHEKTRLCDACHWLPLPSKEEVPDHLPERLP